nr:DNA-binding protein [Methylorubrum zatmanii]
MLRHAPTATLVRRGDEKLPFVEALAGGSLILDTCVYIDQVQGKLPSIIDDLLAVRVVNHSTVALQELMHTVGILDPADPRSQGAIDQIGKIVAAMHPHRLFQPDADVLGRAAVYAGMLCRCQGYAKDDRMRILHDSTLFLQAEKLGLTVLTRNVRDFDCLLQLRPSGRVLFYRT